MMTRTIALFVFTALTIAALPAAAQDAGGNVFTAEPEPVLATHHPLSVDVGLGFSDILDGGQVNFKLGESFAYHFSGTDEGFHVGVMLGEAFSDNVFFFDLAARAGYDFKFAINNGLAFGVNPYVGLGLGYATFMGNGSAAFLIQPGVEAKLYIGQLIYLFLRPLQFSIYIKDGTTSTYDFLTGIGFRF